MNIALRAVLCVWLMLLAAACAAESAPTAAPTQTLLPILPTATSPPPTPTPTPGEVLIPASAQALVGAARDNLARTLSVGGENIELVRLEETNWTEDALNCRPDEGSSADIPGFRLLFAAEGETYEYHTDSHTRIVLCAPDGGIAAENRAPQLNPEAAAMMAELGIDTESASPRLAILLTDPIAAELTALARRLAAQELDLPTRRIRPAAVEPFVWTDNSLGCPQPGESYTPLRTDGYRIVLAIGDAEAIYHTDFERIVKCDAENEALPITPTATASDTPTVTPTPTVTATRTRTVTPTPEEDETGES